MCLCLSKAADGDYWRLLPPGTYIVTAQAMGYTKVMKRVTLPIKMKRAGRVDFVLRPIEIWPNKLLRRPMEDMYDQYDPLELFDPHAQHAQARGGSQQVREKPWWWSYFSSLDLHKPLWLLKQHWMVPSCSTHFVLLPFHPAPCTLIALSNI